jgi:hypothetical protein
MMTLHFDASNDQRTRYASAIAACCGLQVSIEPAKCLSIDGRPVKPCHVWRGTAEQFRRLWFVTPGEADKLAAIKKFCYFTPAWLRGHVYREDQGAYRFVIESGYGLTRQMENRILRQAADDMGLERFMNRLRTPVNID